MQQSKRYTIISKMSCRQSLLRTESAVEFRQLRAAIDKEVQPRGALEEIYFEDTVRTTWEILRLNRVKNELVRAQYSRAVESLIVKLSATPDSALREFLDEPERAAMEELALDWISNVDVRKKVSQFLKKFGLDEFAIEAEAIAISMPLLEKLEQMISSLERRRDRAFAALYWQREYFAGRMQEAVEKISKLEGGNVRRLERPSKPSVA